MMEHFLILCGQPTLILNPNKDNYKQTKPLSKHDAKILRKYVAN